MLTGTVLKESFGCESLITSALMAAEQEAHAEPDRPFISIQ